MSALDTFLNLRNVLRAYLPVNVYGSINRDLDAVQEALSPPVVVVNLDPAAFDGGALPDGEEVIHFRKNGATPCGMPADPRQWPKGHYQTDQLERATCVKCMERGVQI